MQTMNTMVCFPKATETNFPPGFTKFLASGIYVTLFIPFSLVQLLSRWKVRSYDQQTSVSCTG